MIDVFGPTGIDGMFSNGMISCLEVLRSNRDTLLSVLEPFIKDPVIDWKRHRSQQTSSSASIQSVPRDSTHQAKRSINIIRERLSGVYNLRNPNFYKLRTVLEQNQKHNSNDDNGEEDAVVMQVMKLSVEGQVQKLIVEATKTENLVQLYVGWMPWV
jgi:serine/threonine-protein kinase ATR